MSAAEKARELLAGITPGWTFQRSGGQNQNGDYEESILFDADGETLVYGLPDGEGEFIAAAPTLVADLLAELDQAHTWDGLMALLDEHYPEDIFPTTATDDQARDLGPRIVSLLRLVDSLRSERESAIAERDAALATLAEVREIVGNSVPIMLPDEAIRFHERLNTALDRGPR